MRIHVLMRIRAAIASLVLLLSASFVAAECETVPGPPGETLWTVSATQTASGELVILDALGDRLLRLPPGATALTQVSGPVSETLDDLHPVQVRAMPDGDLLLQLAASRSFAPLDRSFDLRAEQSRTVRGASRAGVEIVSTWIWEPVPSENELVVVACSDLYRQTDNDGPTPREGLVWIPLDRPDEFELLLEMPLESPFRFACRLSLPLITTLPDGSVYALVPGHRDAGDPRFLETRIYRAPSGGGPAVPLSASLGNLSQWPRLSTEARSDELPLVMREIEFATTAAGLFGGAGDKLYLLSRSPLPVGGSEWFLTRIDPDSGRAEGKMAISSRANHLLVVPGPKRWALIEKGPVLSFGYQELQRIVWMPVEQLQDWRDGGTLCPGL